MAAVQFIGTLREKTGTGSARAARRSDKIPAVIYGAGITPVHVDINAKEVGLALGVKGFKKTVFELTLGGKTLKVVPREIQFHPVSDKPAHIDLIQVTAKTAIKVFVPVEYTNHTKSPGIKRGGVLNIVKREVEILVNPENIPERIEVDLTGVEIGHAIHINDVHLGEGKPTEKRNFTLATIVGKTADEPVAATTAEATAVAAAATPAAGAKAPAAAAGKAPAAAAKPAAKK